VSAKFSFNAYFIITGLLLWSLSVIGCATKPRIYINPNTNFGFIKRVAVLPFENLSPDRFADKKVRDVFITALLSTEVIDVPELGEVFQILESQGVAKPQDVTTEVAKAVGQVMGVQGLILGTVEEYTINRTAAGSFPEIALTLRMLDTKTGNIIWSVSHTEKGGRILPTIFGFGESTMSEATAKAAKRIVDTLVYE
jgi:curli biogenesis system outer membrane secretion channel CsgG